MNFSFKVLSFLFTSLLLIACQQKTVKVLENQNVKVDTIENIQTGDLLFVGLPVSYSIAPDARNLPANAETCAGDSLNLIHVAILEVQNDTVWVIDATIKHDVCRYPLDTFLADFTLADGSLPRFIIKRLKDNSKAVDYVENAKKFLGCAYDTEFLADNEAQFCSELVRNSFVTADGQFLFEEVPMNWQKSDGTPILYWQQLFGLIHAEIPQGRMGTTPAQMISSPLLRTVNAQPGK